MKSAYILSKPLQYFNCVNIEDTNNEKDCYISNGFSEINLFIDVIRHNTTFFTKIELYKTKLSALLHVCLFQKRYNKIFIDTDYGLVVRFILLFFKSVKIYTYEEGYASYNYLRNSNSVKDKILLKISAILKINNWSGGSSKISGSYLYDHNLFKRNIIVKDYSFLKKFKLEFWDNIACSKELEFLCEEIDFSIFKNKNLIVYLSSWEMSSKIYEIIDNYQGYFKLLKLHPNIRIQPKEVLFHFDYIIPSNIIFEYFLYRIRNEVNQMIIIHHGTFALQYLDKLECDKIVQIQID